MFKMTNTFDPHRRMTVGRRRDANTHPCKICGGKIYGKAAICPECLVKMTEEGARQYGKR